MPVSAPSRAGALVVGGLFLAPFALAYVLRDAHPLLALGAWTLAYAGAAYGIGSIVDRVFLDGASGVPLRLGYGFATIAWATGCLAALRAGERGALWWVVVGGLVAAMADVLREPPRFGWWLRGGIRGARAHPVPVLLASLALAWLGLRFVLSFHTRAEGFLFDDGEAYLVFVRQLFQTGSFDQPLSVRRLQSLGGMTGLLAVLFADGGTQLAHAYVLDWGLGPVLTAGAVLAVPVRAGGAWMRAAALVLLATTHPPLTNASPQYLAVFLGLVLALALARSERAASFHRIPIGLLAAALASLRQSLLPWAAAIVVAHHAFAFFAVRDARSRRAIALRLVADGALTALFLAPWMVQAQRLFGTPLYPLLRGRVSDEGAAFMVTHVGAVQLLDTLGVVVRAALPLAFPATVLLAVSVLLRGRGPRSAAAAAVAWLVAIALQVRTLPLTDGTSQARYAFAATLATALLAIVASATARAARLPAVFVAGLAVAVALVADRARLGTVEWRDLEVARGRVAVPAGDDAARDARYAAAQATIPRGERVLVMAEESFRLDQATHRIVVLDFPGALGGLPVHEGAGAMRDHLRAAGYHYLVFEHSLAAEAMFSRFEWQRHERSTSDQAAHAVAPLWLATFDAFEVIAWACERTFDDAVLAVVDLDRCPQFRPRT